MQSEKLFKSSDRELPPENNKSYLCWVYTDFGAYPAILQYIGDGQFRNRPRWDESAKDMEIFHVNQGLILWTEIPDTRAHSRPDTADMREAFEAWATENGAWPHTIARSTIDPERYAHVQRSWEDWQAAWQAAYSARPSGSEREAPEVYSDTEGKDNYRAFSKDELIATIRRKEAAVEELQDMLRKTRPSESAIRADERGKVVEECAKWLDKESRQYLPNEEDSHDVVRYCAMKIRALATAGKEVG